MASQQNFLKVFWKQIGNFIVSSINFGSTKGEVSVTQNKVLLHVCPKKEKANF